jgi:diguanylate cyclase (GGDEF)-like protein
MRLIKSKSDLSLAIKYYMTSPVDTVRNTFTIKKALAFVKSKHYKRIVVVDEAGLFEGVIDQSELISLTYSNWATLMKEYQEELDEINLMLENKNKEYEHLASTDALTGLYNRYKFSELFLSSYKTMTQRDNKMSIIMLDIDFFKKVNDTYGHNVGDKVLIQVSHAILRTLRSIDIVSRWGGEEFMMLLPTADLDNASKLAEKIRLEIENQEIDIAGYVSVSLGVCEVREGDSMEDAVKRADDALYLAKNSGRNCVKTQKDL